MTCVIPSQSHNISLLLIPVIQLIYSISVEAYLLWKCCHNYWLILNRTVTMLLELHGIFTARNEVGARLCFHRHVWFCSQGGSAPVHAGINPPQSRHPPPEADTPQSRHPPRSRHPPEADTPLEQTSRADPPGVDTPWSRHPPAEHAGRYGQCAGGMHPTGIQSCLLVMSSVTGNLCNKCPKWLVKWNSSYIDYFNAISGHYRTADPQEALWQEHI